MARAALSTVQPIRLVVTLSPPHPQAVLRRQHNVTQLIVCNLAAIFNTRVVFTAFNLCTEQIFGYSMQAELKLFIYLDTTQHLCCVDYNKYKANLLQFINFERANENQRIITLKHVEKFVCSNASVDDNVSTAKQTFSNFLHPGSKLSLILKQIGLFHNALLGGGGLLFYV